MVGAKVIFVDVNPKTMNIDENEIEKAITAENKSYCSSSLCWNFT